VFSRSPSSLDPGKEDKFERRKKNEIRRIKRKEALSRMHRSIGYTLRPLLDKVGLSRVDIPTSDTGDPTLKYGKGHGPL
jgi:hypothetical protein